MNLKNISTSINISTTIEFDEGFYYVNAHSPFFISKNIGKTSKEEIDNISEIELSYWFNNVKFSEVKFDVYNKLKSILLEQRGQVFLNNRIIELKLEFVSYRTLKEYLNKVMV